MSDYKIPGEYVYDGITLGKSMPAEVIEELKCLELKEGDILMDAYPKSGGCIHGIVGSLSRTQSVKVYYNSGQ